MFPQLSLDTLEGLLVVLASAKDDRGIHVVLPLNFVFSPDMVKQLDQLLVGTESIQFH